MSQPAVTVENISKLYKLGKAMPQGNIREAFVGAIGSTFRKIRGYGEDRAKSQDFWALKDVSFEINQGEAVGVLGRNGAGKSTLLKILSRITEPTEGQARLRGRVGSLLEVGTGFHSELTGRENIYLNGSILGMKRAEIARKFDEIVAFSEVEQFLDTPVKRYSSGMYVRLAFAVAAHLEPEILVVDEVLAVGDIDFQRKCLGKMNEVVGHGRTVFFVSHNMQSITALTNRCVVMKAGKVFADAPTNEAVKAYIEMALQGSALGVPYINREGDPDSNYLAEARVITTESYGQQVYGQSIAFEFVMHVGQPVARLCFAFSILNAQGLKVTHCWLMDENLPFQSKKGDFVLRCEIPKLHIYQGNYSLTTWISDTRGFTGFENLTDICPFEVTMGDFRRKGYEWNNDLALYLDDFTWNPIVEH